MPIFWMRTWDTVGDPTWPADSFSAFDPEVVFPRIHSRHDGEYVGTVRLNGDGSTRGDAGRAMHDCYKRYLRSRLVDYTR